MKAARTGGDGKPCVSGLLPGDVRLRAMMNSIANVGSAMLEAGFSMGRKRRRVAMHTIAGQQQARQLPGESGPDEADVMPRSAGTQDAVTCLRGGGIRHTYCIFTLMPPSITTCCPVTNPEASLNR